MIVLFGLGVRISNPRPQETEAAVVPLQPRPQSKDPLPIKTKQKLGGGDTS